MNTLSDFLLDVADNAIDEMRDDGALPAGTNGPWDDEETPVRNTSHGIVIFLKAFEITGDEQYLRACKRAVDYVLSPAARPHGETFYHRISTERDACNGVIGQAWTIEALSVAAHTIDDPRLVETATDVFLRHPFDERLCLWRPVEIDGTVRPIDMTFNHQLWFAAAGGLLTQHPEIDPEVDRQVRLFLDELTANMDLYDSGVIKHLYKPAFDVGKYATVFIDGVRDGTAHKMAIGLAKSLVDVGDDKGDEDPMLEKAIGYHSFNLYGFGLLRESYPDHPFWDSEKIDRVLAVARTDEFAAQLDGNPYGYPYNCTGIELAYTLEVFDRGTEHERQKWLERQFNRTYDPEQQTLSRNTEDPVTLTARVYEATRLSDWEILLPDIGRTG